MHDIELLRLTVALAMLSVASYSDIKRREVNDLVWIVFGGTGAVLYLLGQDSPLTFLHLGIGISIGTGLLLSRVFGQADSIAVFALAVTIPTFENLPVALIITAVTPVLASAFLLCYNVGCNLSDALHGRLYAGIREGLYRKAAAFLVLHRRRGYERFVFRAQRGNKLVFRLRPATDSEFAEDFDGYVTSAIPLIPFMLASMILILFL